METKYVKMNNNQKELSLGNFCRIVKEQSINKSYAGQPDVFYALFLVEDVSDSTINNYCIGYRTIAAEFKKIYQKRKKYPNEEFDETIQNLISIIKGNIYSEITHEEIKKEAKNTLKKLVIELYNIAKNDKSVPNEFTKKINEFIKKEKIYECICEILLFIVLEKKQPVYIDKTRREIFESMLNNTNISMNDLEQFLKIQLKDGINYTYSLKKLTKENNPYASFELGEMEYTGIMSGSPRYIKAYEYFKIAASQNHPRANWLIGKMLLEGQIGKKKNEDLEKAFKYYLFSANLEESWASNKLGEWYRKGIYVKKDEKKAYEYFKKATEVPKNILDHWAYYNIAKYYYLEGSYEAEIEKNINKAIEYFEKTLPLIEESYEELIYIYIDKYKQNQKEEYLKIINEYLSTLSTKSYYKKCEEKIKAKLKALEKEKIIIIKNI